MSRRVGGEESEGNYRDWKRFYDTKQGVTSEGKGGRFCLDWRILTCCFTYSTIPIPVLSRHLRTGYESSTKCSDSDLRNLSRLLLSTFRLASIPALKPGTKCLHNRNKMLIVTHEKVSPPTPPLISKGSTRNLHLSNSIPPFSPHPPLPEPL